MVIRDLEMPRVFATLTAVTIVGSVLGAACAAERQGTPAVDTSAVRAQIDTVWAGFTRAMLNADTAALARYYTDSASFAETGVPTTRGRAALVSGAAQALASMRYIESRFDPEVTELAGNRAFQFGTYRDVVQPTGQAPLEVRGRVAAVLARDTIGTWRVARLVVIRDSVRPLSSSR